MPALEVATIPMVGVSPTIGIGIKYDFVISMTLGNIPTTLTRVARSQELELGSVTLDTTRSGNIRLTIEGFPTIYDVGFLPEINFGQSFGSIQATKSGTHISEDRLNLRLTSLTIDKSIGSLDLEKHPGIRGKNAEIADTPLLFGYVGFNTNIPFIRAWEIPALDTPGVAPAYILTNLGFIRVNFGMSLGGIQLTNA